MNNYKSYKEYKKFPDTFYEVSVLVNNKEEAKDVVEKWVKLNKPRRKEQNYYRFDSYDYPFVIYLVSQKNYEGTIWGKDNGEFSGEVRYTPLTYKEFISTFFYKPNKNLRQLQFESVEEENPFKGKLYVVNIANLEEAKKVIDIMTIRYNAEGGEKLYDIFKRDLRYKNKTTINLSNQHVLSYGYVEFHKDNGYKVLTFKEFLKMTEKKSSSRYVKQLQFESETKNKDFRDSSGRFYAVVVKTRNQIDNLVDFAIKNGYGYDISYKDMKNVVEKLLKNNKEQCINLGDKRDIKEISYTKKDWYEQFPDRFNVISYDEFMNKYDRPSSKYVKQLQFENFKDYVIENSQVPLPLFQNWYKKEYDKEYRFNRIVCRKCNKDYVDDNKITNRVKCPNCGFKGGVVQ